MDNSNFDGINEFLKLIPNIYKDALQPTVQVIGKTLASIIEFGTVHLTFPTEKKKALFAQRLKELGEKNLLIPNDRLIPIDPTFGTPLIEKLAYVTEDNIARMYINLLNKASDSNSFRFAHPKYVRIVERLSPEEAKILFDIFTNGNISISYNFGIMTVESETTYSSISGELEVLDTSKYDYFDYSISNMNDLVTKYMVENDPEAISYINDIIEKRPDILKRGNGEFEQFLAPSTYYWTFYGLTPLGKEFASICLK